ncbi:MAG: hypothetical protein KF718_21910 [Polyangiaceae bacterium]|nr:hypothetical protein [Polyangiaceae bacterium]
MNCYNVSEAQTAVHNWSQSNLAPALVDAMKACAQKVELAAEQLGSK